MNPRRVGDVANRLAGIEIEHDDVGRSRNIKTTRRRIRGQIIPTTIAAYLVSVHDLISRISRRNWRSSRIHLAGGKRCGGGQ